MKISNVYFLMAAVVVAGALGSCNNKSAAPKGIDASNLDTLVSPKTISMITPAVVG